LIINDKESIKLFSKPMFHFNNIFKTTNFNPQFVLERLALLVHYKKLFASA